MMSRQMLLIKALVFGLQALIVDQNDLVGRKAQQVCLCSEVSPWQAIVKPGRVPPQNTVLTWPVLGGGGCLMAQV